MSELGLFSLGGKTTRKAVVTIFRFIRGHCKKEGDNLFYFSMSALHKTNIISLNHNKADWR